MTDTNDVVWSSEDDEDTQEAVADLYGEDWYDSDDFGTMSCGCCSCCGCLCEPWENDDE